MSSSSLASHVSSDRAMTAIEAGSPAEARARKQACGRLFSADKHLGHAEKLAEGRPSRHLFSIDAMGKPFLREQ